MKKYTVKDFINDHSPCFSCQEKVSVNIYSQGTPDPSGVQAIPAKLSATVTSDFTEGNLSVKYDSSLVLRILHKTNRIQTSNVSQLTQYLDSHRLSVSVECKCGTSFHSQFLDFDLLKGHIKPVGMSSEYVVVKHRNHIYRLRSYYLMETSHIRISKSVFDGTVPMTLEAPLITMSKFKNKQAFIDKIKTYLIFS